MRLKNTDIHRITDAPITLTSVEHRYTLKYNYNNKTYEPVKTGA